MLSIKDRTLAVMTAPAHERTGPVPPQKGGTAPIGQALPKILNMPVPHSGHLPFMALRPLAIVTSPASFMLRLALHFTQYASTTAAISFGFLLQAKLPGEVHGNVMDINAPECKLPVWGYQQNSRERTGQSAQFRAAYPVRCRTRSSVFRATARAFTAPTRSCSSSLSRSSISS